MKKLYFFILITTIILGGLFFISNFNEVQAARGDFCCPACMPPIVCNPYSLTCGEASYCCDGALSLSEGDSCWCDAECNSAGGCSVTFLNKPGVCAPLCYAYGQLVLDSGTPCCAPYVKGDKTYCCEPGKGLAEGSVCYCDAECLNNDCGYFNVSTGNWQCTITSPSLTCADLGGTCCAIGAKCLTGWMGVASDCFHCCADAANCFTCPTACCDTDGSINYDQKGYCVDSSVHPDVCVGSSLMEWYCSGGPGGICQSLIYTCPSGCSDGACLAVPGPGLPPVPPAPSPPVDVIGNPLQINSIGELIEKFIDIIFKLALVATPLMIIVGGLYFIGSGGDTAKITTAKNIILYTFAGLLVVLFARGLVAIIKWLLIA